MNFPWPIPCFHENHDITVIGPGLLSLAVRVAALIASDRRTNMVIYPPVMTAIGWESSTNGYEWISNEIEQWAKDFSSENWRNLTSGKSSFS